MLCVLLCIITLIELTVQFNTTTFSGTEESGFIMVTIVLLGGTANRDFNISIATSPVTAIGE